MSDHDQFVRPGLMHAYTPRCDETEHGGACIRVVPGTAYDDLATRLTDAAAKVQNVAECWSAGMNSADCVKELRLIARSMSNADSADASRCPRCSGDKSQPHRNCVLR